MSANAWLATLLRASVEGGVLLLLIWAVVSLWPRMPAAALCGLWWVGSLRMLVGLVPLPAIPVPWKAAWPSWTPSVPAPMLELGNAVAGGVVTPAVAAPPRSPADLIPIVLVAVWGAGVAVGLAILARRLGALRRAWRAARAFEDPRVAAWQTEWAVTVGRGRVPEVRAGTAGQVPVTFGALRPGLLLPPDSSRLSDDALRMVLAHEMSHVRRRDPLLGSIPATAQLLFWFFPLVRVAAREYLAAREQASDADALRATGVAPGDYGALLLDYGVGRMSDAPGAACCGSRGVRDLKRRLDMLSRTVRVPALHRAGAAGIVLVIVALAFAPVRFVGASPEKSKAREDEARALAEKRKVEARAESGWKREAAEEAAQEAVQEADLDAREQEKRAYRHALG